MSRPTEQAKSITVSASLPAAVSSLPESEITLPGSAAIFTSGAGLVLFECTAVNGLTGTVEVLTRQGGTWRTWPSYQRALATDPARVAAGTTITLVLGDMVFVDTTGFYAARFKRAGGTSATFTVRTGEDILGFLLSSDTTAVSTADAAVNYTALLDEALPSIVTSVQLFANAPATTKRIELTLRTAGMTMTQDGVAATAGANGNDFSSGTVAPHVFRINQTRALLCRAIQNGGTATGWVTYLG